MKKYYEKTKANKGLKHSVKSPSLFLLYCSSIILSIIYFCGIVITWLPESIFDPGIAQEYSFELFASSFRIAALSAIFITIAAILEQKYPAENDNS